MADNGYNVPELPHWKVGDTVWLRSGDHQRPAVITLVGTDYGVEAETHEDGYVCQQYLADVTFGYGVEHDMQVSHCLLTARDTAEEINADGHDTDD